jgi:putative endonuclease
MTVPPRLRPHAFRRFIRNLSARWKRPLNAAVANRKSLNRIIGNLGEDTAVAELQRQNYRILERNYRCSAGEIDVIAEQRGMLAFVEVKTRSPRALATPEEAVDAAKQARIRNAAANYLAGFRKPSPIRYDIVSVMLDAQDRPVSVSINAGAFE